MKMQYNIYLAFIWATISSCLITFSLCNHIRGLDDTILFRIKWPGLDEALLESEDYEKLEMVSTNNEKFQCLIPLNYGESEDKSAGYTGKDAFSLLLNLFTKQICTLRREFYWIYEICHGRHIKQYHEIPEVGEKKTKRVHEYTLGKTTTHDVLRQADQFKANLLGKPDAEIPTTNVEGMIVPYVRVDYTDGTLCDLTGQPRVSHILYVCFKEGRNDVYSIKEVYTCEYEIVVLSPLLCEHPAYQPQETPQTDLHCISMTPGGAMKPRKLIQYEAENLRLITHGGTLTSDIKSGTLKLNVNEEPSIISSTITAKEILTKKTVPKTPPSIDKRLVEDFLSGDYCLHGGSGWWKFEFCYGKTVDQYHEDKDGTKIVISLGVFNEEDHIKWMLENPNKQYKQGKRQVSHFYSGGSICDLSGKSRTVEVKLKCKESESPNSFALYLMEPSSCEYILGVESSIICPLLQYADTVGLFHITEEQTKDVISEINSPESTTIIVEAPTIEIMGTISPHEEEYPADDSIQGEISTPPDEREMDEDYYQDYEDPNNVSVEDNTDETNTNDKELP